MVELAVRSGKTWRLMAKLAEAEAATDRVAREIFGDAAYVRRRYTRDRETGRKEAVFEVHYCFPDEESVLDAVTLLHQRFMCECAKVISPDVLGRIILWPVITEAQAD